MKISCGFNLAALYSSDYASFDSLQNTQILDLSIFVPRPFLLQKLVRFSLGTFRFTFQCSFQHISRSFPQKIPLGKEFGYAVPEHACQCTYAIRGTCAQEGPSGGLYFWTYIAIY